LINRYCDNAGVERTKRWVVVQKANRHQLFDFVPLAATMGFRSLTFSLDLTSWGQDKWSAANAAVLAEDAFGEETSRRIVERGAQLGIKVAFWSVTEKYSRLTPEKRCPWPFERLYVSSDLRIVPCCAIANPQISDLGNAEDVTQAWHAKRYVEFRKQHIEGPVPDICRGCYVAEDPEGAS
jgi:pyrroloquinoline quinone biosynthesis protein E